MLLVLAGGLLLGLLPAVEGGDDRPASDDSEIAAQMQRSYKQAPPAKIVFENELVIVKDVTLQPGEANFLHEHKYPQVYVLLEGSRITGDLKRKAAPAGQLGRIGYEMPAKHEGFNVGDKVHRYIVIELKDKPGAASATTSESSKTEAAKTEPTKP
jgi:hypothetical protein